MPTYDYVCEACGHAFEHFQSMSEKRLSKCPKCGKAKLVRQVGAGAGVIFKGSGFYQTDYKAKSSAGKSEASKKESASDASPAGGSSSDAPCSPACGPTASGCAANGASSDGGSQEAEAKPSPRREEPRSKSGAKPAAKK